MHDSRIKSSPSPVQTLSHAPKNRFLKIKEVDDSISSSHRLRELGFFENSCIRKVTANGSFVIQIGNHRIALSSQITDHIFVQEI
ncbi:MAG: FeoA family protein [Verrucomicrobiota bacterium]|nr:FeoA family protein [Verrucomicrobiota bacterium]